MRPRDDDLLRCLPSRDLANHVLGEYRTMRERVLHVETQAYAPACPQQSLDLCLICCGDRQNRHRELVGTKKAPRVREVHSLFLDSALAPDDCHRTRVLCFLQNLAIPQYERDRVGMQVTVNRHHYDL